MSDAFTDDILPRALRNHVDPHHVAAILCAVEGVPYKAHDRSYWTGYRDCAVRHMANAEDEHRQRMAAAAERLRRVRRWPFGGWR